MNKMKNILKIGGIVFGLVLILLTVAGSANASVVIPSKSVINPVTQTVYVPNNGSSPAEVRIYYRSGNSWLETRKIVITTSTTAKVYGLAISADGKKLFVSINDSYQSQLRIYDLDLNNYGIPATYNYQLAQWTPASYDSPAGVTVVDNRAYVADMGSARVHIFDYAGSIWKKTGEITEGLTGLGAIYDVTTGPKVNNKFGYSYPIFVSRKTNVDAQTKQLFMYSYNYAVNPQTYVVTTSITFSSSVNASVPTYMKVANGKLYVAVKDAAADVKTFDYTSGALVEDATPINNGTNLNYGWAGLDLAPDGSALYYTQAQNSNENPTSLIKVVLPGTNPIIKTTNASPYDGLVITSDNMYAISTYSWAGTIQAGMINTQAIKPVITSISPTQCAYGVTTEAIVTGKYFTGITIINFGGADMPTSILSPTTVKVTVDGSFFDKIKGEINKIQVFELGGRNGSDTTQIVTFPNVTFTVNPLTANLVPTVTKVYPAKAPNTADISIVIEGTNFDANDNTVMLQTPQPTKLNAKVNSSTSETVTIPQGLAKGIYHITVANQYGPSAQTAVDTFEVILGGEDTTPPTTEGMSFNASDGGTAQVVLYWANPSDPDLKKIVIVKNETGWPAIDQSGMVTKGSTIYSNDLPVPAGSDTYTDTNVSTDKVYYYALFARDTSGNWSTIVIPKTNADTGITGTTSKIIVLQPNGGEVLAPNSKYDIIWDKAPDSHVKEYFKIEFSQDGGTNWKSVIDSIAGNIYTWDVPNINTTQARIRVSLVTDPKIFDISDNNFIIGQVQTPTVTSIDPNNGALGNVVPIINLVGANFVDGVTVKITRGGVDLNAYNVNVKDPAHISCALNIPANAQIGAWDVIVTNPGNKTGSLPGGFTVFDPILAPKVTAIAPNIGTVGNAVAATITGEKFVNGAVAYLAKTGYPNITGTTSFVNDKSLTFNFTIPANEQVGLWSVIVMNPDSQKAVLYNGFSIVSDAAKVPTITAVYPGRGPSYADTNVIIEGTNFTQGDAVTIQTVTEMNLKNVIVTSPTKMQAAVPAGLATGIYHIVASNQYGASQQTAADTFEVMSGNENPPVPSQVTNFTATPGNTLVTLKWTNPNDNDMAQITVRRSDATDLPINPINYPAYNQGTEIYGAGIIPKPGDSSNNVTDAGLTNDKVYYYVAYIKDTSGNWSVLDYDTVGGQNAATGQPTATAGGAITDLNIVRDGDTPNSSVTVSWKTNPALHAPVKIYVTKNGAFTTNAAADWTLVANPVIITKGDLDTYTDTNQVGNGTAKYYKILPSTSTLANSDLASGVIGKFDLSVGPSDAEPDKLFISLPLFPIAPKTNSIADVLGAQVSEGDGILAFNMNKDVVTGSLYSAGVWSAFPGVPAINTVDPGRAYGYLTTTSKFITIVGKVLDTDNAAISLTGGWDNVANQAAIAEWIGNAYPMPVTISNVGLTNATTQGTDPTNAGTVYQFNANADLLNGIDGMAVNTTGGWMNGTLINPSTLQLVPGRGYMLNEPVKATFNWAQPKPY
ncbi:MAG: IPT/TIG domain-containing protein [Candidatus Margulisbacteria bacterium]|nr:IPT/TIG domain-containing protein [Candidatus Margulisiibacteriota bacterium]